MIMGDLSNLLEIMLLPAGMDYGLLNKAECASKDITRCRPRGYANSCKMAGICGRLQHLSFDLHFKIPPLLPLPSMLIFLA
jgi:hypothetical protein